MKRTIVILLLLLITLTGCNNSTTVISEKTTESIQATSSYIDMKKVENYTKANSNSSIKTDKIKDTELVMIEKLLEKLTISSYQWDLFISDFNEISNITEIRSIEIDGEGYSEEYCYNIYEYNGTKIVLIYTVIGSGECIFDSAILCNGIISYNTIDEHIHNKVKEDDQVFFDTKLNNLRELCPLPYEEINGTFCGFDKNTALVTDKGFLLLGFEKSDSKHEYKLSSKLLVDKGDYKVIYDSLINYNDLK